jgi:hypothetical protein
MDSLDRERLCDPGTDATIGTSDEGDAIFEVQFHMHLCSCCRSARCRGNN